MLTVLRTHNLRDRAQLLRAGFFVGLLVMVLCCIMGVINLQAWDYNLTGVLVCLAVAFGVSMLTSVLISGVLPIIEGAFKNHYAYFLAGNGGYEPPSHEKAANGSSGNFSSLSDGCPAGGGSGGSHWGQSH